jgi:hypothetical protein
MPDNIQQLKQPRQPKDLRYRNQHFPNADSLVFSTSSKGFVPVPIILRKLLRHLSAPEIRALLYLYLRASRHSICYPTQEEMAYEVGLDGTKNLIPALKKLEQKHFISTRTSLGKKYYLIHDPRVAVEHLVATGVIAQDELDDINQLREDLGQQSIPSPATDSSARAG